MTFLEELTSLYLNSQISKLYTQAVKDAIRQSAADGNSFHIQKFDRTHHDVYEIDKFITSVKADGLYAKVIETTATYFTVRISGWKFE